MSLPNRLAIRSWEVLDDVVRPPSLGMAAAGIVSLSVLGHRVND
ncbi:hypothetical protein [Rhodanobacter soli]